MAPRRTGRLGTGVVDRGTLNIQQPTISPLLKFVRERKLSDTSLMQREESRTMVGTGVKMNIFSKDATVGMPRLS
jgi:hypothetical protein